MEALGLKGGPSICSMNDEGHPSNPDFWNFISYLHRNLHRN